VVGAEFNWRRGVFEKVSHAQGFYATLAASIALAAAVDLAGVPVLGTLIAASVIGGLGTPIGMVLLVRLARNPQVMGDQPISARLAISGWTVTVVVGGFGLLYIVWAVLGLF